MNTSEETTVNGMGKKINMKPQYAAVVLFLLFMASSLASIGSFQSTSRMVNEDMDRALAGKWENIAAVSCSHSGIGALTAGGQVFIHGNIIGDLEAIRENWKETQRN